jgi:hypothetical protein
MERVVRGGSWDNDPTNCRRAYRNRNIAPNFNNNLGFRVVLPHVRGLWPVERVVPATAAEVQNGAIGSRPLVGEY